MEIEETNSLKDAGNTKKIISIWKIVWYELQITTIICNFLFWDEDFHAQNKILIKCQFFIQYYIDYKWQSFCE